MMSIAGTVILSLPYCLAQGMLAAAGALVQ